MRQTYVATALEGRLTDTLPQREEADIRCHSTSNTWPYFWTGLSRCKDHAKQIFCAMSRGTWKQYCQISFGGTFFQYPIPYSPGISQSLWVCVKYTAWSDSLDLMASQPTRIVTYSQIYKKSQICLFNVIFYSLNLCKYTTLLKFCNLKLAKRLLHLFFPV